LYAKIVDANSRNLKVLRKSVQFARFHFTDEFINKITKEFLEDKKKMFDSTLKNSMSRILGGKKNGNKL